MKRLLLTTAATALLASPAFAIPQNITVADGQTGNGAAGVWRGLTGQGVGQEDNETEPNTYTGDIWDLEAFVLVNGTSLGVVGTFNLQHGLTYGGRQFSAGDIFFDTGGGIAADGLGGWEYVIHPNWSAGTYEVFANPAAARLIPVTDVKPSSNPFTYDPLSTETPLAEGQFSYYQDNSLGLLSETPGAAHNVALFDIAFLGPNREFTSHFTLNCGNDELIGHYWTPAESPPSDVPDSGGTVLLLATALLALITVRREA